MKWIYASGTEKKRQTIAKVNKPTGPISGGFFSSLFSSLSGTSTPQRTSTPSLPLPPKPVDYLSINETSVSLSIYSASIQVRLDKKLASEIQRSTKKNPPSKMKFELIYVCFCVNFLHMNNMVMVAQTGKEEYDLSLEEESKQPEATGSIFQGLRADIEG